MSRDRPPVFSLSPSLTIARSSIAIAAIVLVGCVRGSPAGTKPPGTQEAPAPHLRDAVDGAQPSYPEHTDPVPDPAMGNEVSLGGILAYADENSPVLSVARSTRSRAEAARVAAAIALPFNPELSIAVGQRMGPTGKGIDIQASLMQQIQVAGERGVRIDAAERLRDVTDADIEQMRWAVHCDVHAAYHLALVERERMYLAERVLGFQQDVLRIVERQIAVGESASLTLRLAQAEVAQAQQVLVAAQQRYLASRIRLAQLSGWPASTPPTPAGAVEDPIEPPPLDQLTAIAHEQLPSLRAAEARVREAEARGKVARREMAPNPSIGIIYNREGNPRPAEVPYNIVMGAISVPIPSFQRNQGDRARTHADVTVAKAELDATRKLLEGKIAEARSEVVAAAQRSKVYAAEIVPRFEENLTLLQRSFELGEIDILALSVGRERFLRIQSDALTAQQDYFVALAGLERVVGIELTDDDHHVDAPEEP